MKLTFWKKEKLEPAVFELHRLDDFSGISGTGHVLDGVVFPGGKTVIRWRSDKPSTAIFDTFRQFEKVHVAQHGKSKIVWIKGFDGAGFMVRYLHAVANELNQKFSKAPETQKEGYLEALKLIRNKATELERTIRDAGETKQITVEQKNRSGKNELLKTPKSRKSTESAPQNNDSAPQIETKKTPTNTN